MPLFLERGHRVWDALIDLARRWGGMNVLLVGLGLTESLFAVQLPDRVRRRLKDAPAVHRLVVRQSRRIFDEDRLVTLRLGSLPEFLRMPWTQLDNPRHFARWVVRKLETPVIEDLAPDAERGRALRSTTVLAPMEALRRLLRARR